MKTLKMQQEALKAAAKGNHYFKHFEDEFCAHIGNGHVVLIINKSDYFLNDNCFKAQALPSGFWDTDNAELIMDTSTVKLSQGRGLRIFESKNENIFIDTKYLKYFEEESVFKSNGGDSPVYVYEGGVLVGAVMPVIMLEGK